MARADRRRAQRQARHARTAGRSRRASGGAKPARVVEDTLFFTRLRRHARWAFVLMVLIFGGGFVFLGVGSGGLDLGQLIQDTFGNKGSSGGSISDARKDAAEHPRDASRLKKLGDVLERKGHRDEAIAAFEQYIALRPKDAEQLSRLGRLEVTKADEALAAAQLAFIAQQEAVAGSAFGASPSGKLGRQLGNNPIQAAVSTKTSAQFQQAQVSYQSSVKQAMKTLKRLTRVRPDSSSFLALANAAEHFQQTPTAVRAYKKLLKLVSDPATKAQVRAKIAALQP